jgi:hypothetical protein
MFTRRSRSAKRKFRLGFEDLEVKQSPSAGLLAGGAEAALVPATPLTASGAEVTRISIPICGTGKGIVIITHCEVGPPTGHTA